GVQPPVTALVPLVPPVTALVPPVTALVPPATLSPASSLTPSSAARTADPESPILAVERSSLSLLHLSFPIQVSSHLSTRLCMYPCFLSRSQSAAPSLHTYSSFSTSVQERK